MSMGAGPSCLEVRDRLAEFALDALPEGEAREVDRHLEWCLACRKEAGELLEGAAKLAFALPPVSPSGGLEPRVVERMAVATGHRKPSQRRGYRLALVAAAVAILFALGSLTWGIAQRRQADSLQSRVEQTARTMKQLSRFIQGLKANGKVLYYSLSPPPGSPAGSGDAVIGTAPDASDWVFVRVILFIAGDGPYQVLMQQRSGATLLAGDLVRTNNDDYVLTSSPRYFIADLSKVIFIMVVDHHGRVVLAGAVRPTP